MLTGMIMLWSGAVVDIPFSWHLCDGALGTPDLRNRFIVAAGDTYDPDDTGGATLHEHTWTSNGHTHTIPGGSGIDAGPDFATVTDVNIDTGTTDGANSLPPYYALCYIMKL